MPKKKPGRPPVSDEERYVTRSVSVPPWMVDYWISVSPRREISQGVRMVTEKAKGNKQP